MGHSDYMTILAPSTSTSIALPPPPQPEESPEDELTSNDILASQGVTSARLSDHQVASGVQLLIVNETAEFEREGTADWMMAANFVEEYGMAEAVEPLTRASTEANNHFT
jgi:hypothetical protein